MVRVGGPPQAQSRATWQGSPQHGQETLRRQLPYSATEDQLTELFGRAGKVDNVRVMRDMATGRARGFAFVEMGTDEEAQKAITEFHEQQMDGRALVVNEARPKPEGGFGGGRRRARPGGFGGGGGGRGRDDGDFSGGRRKNRAGRALAQMTAGGWQKAAEARSHLRRVRDVLQITSAPPSAIRYLPSRPSSVPLDHPPVTQLDDSRPVRGVRLRVRDLDDRRAPSRSTC